MSEPRKKKFSIYLFPSMIGGRTVGYTISLNEIRVQYVDGGKKNALKFIERFRQAKIEEALP